MTEDSGQDDVTRASPGAPEPSADVPRELGSYRLLGVIGRGGMGVVWKAVDTRLDREVALKTLPADMAADEERLARFKREAKAVASLNHPNIVTIHSVEQAQGTHFFTMELVEGQTLAEVIPRQGLTLGQFLDVAIAITDALSAAHERGIIHRDLKPGNVMVGPEGRVKILDFGLAKQTTLHETSPSGEDLATRTHAPVTATGQVLGTVPYMSPEQLQGRPLDPRSDLFSVGIILYEMATGQRPFRGDSSVDVITSILRDAPRSVTDVKSELPKDLARIVRRCLDKDVEHRFQTAKEIRNELEDLKREIGTTQLERRVGPGGTPTARRLPRPALLAGLAVVALAVLAAAVWLMPRRAHADLGNSAIAVMPFVNLTGDPGKDYLSEGISAGLASRLAEISGVRIVGRSAADPSGAKRMGVGVLIEGGVQRQAERLRIDVTMTQAGTGLLLWSDAFDGDENEPFELQQKIARELAKVLAIRLTPKELRRLAADPTGSIKSYEYFLRAHRRMEDLGDTQGPEAAVEMFRHALRLDPEFALAHVGLSEALWRSYLKNKIGDGLSQAESAARRALEIDPELPAALVALARVQRSTGRYSESIAGLEQALSDHPKPDDALRELASTYEEVGDMEEAERCFRAATALGEEDWFNWNGLGAFLERGGRYADARDAFEEASTVAPDEVSTPAENLAAMTILEGRFDDALAIYDRLPRPVRDPALASNIGTAYYFSTRADKWTHAEEHYVLAVRLAPQNPTYHRNLADLYLELDRREEGLRHYREALAIVGRLLEEDPASHSLRLDRTLYAAKAEDCTAAVSQADDLQAELPNTAYNAHQLALAYALCDRRDAALAALRAAVELGIPGKFLRQEPEFARLRDDPEFLALTGP